MGLHPLFRLNCRRRSGFLRQALAPHQAKPGLFSGGVSSIKEPPVTGFRLPGFKIASRASFRRQEIRSPPDRSRVTYGATALDFALWAPWERAAEVAIFSLSIKSLRLKTPSVNLKPPPKYFVKVQRITHRGQGTHGACRPIPISTESLIRSAVRATPNLDLIEVAALATVL